MKNCFITLNLMLKNFQSEVTSIALLEDTILELEECEIKGKIDANCLGMYVNKGNLRMNKVLIRDF